MKLYILCTLSVCSEYMETKTIALDKEAYQLLAEKKGKDESFSDVVKRIAGIHRPLTDFVGIWGKVSKEDLKKIEEAIQKGRELDRKRAVELMKRWG